VKRRRVCSVLPSLNGGGAERAAVAIINGMDAAAWDRSMYLFKREVAYLNDLSPAVHLSSGRSFAGAAKVARLRRYFNDTQPDVVVAFLSYVSVLVAARTSTAHARVVFNQQTPVSSFLDDRDYAWARFWHRQVFTAASRVAYGRADLVIATSTGVADDVHEYLAVSASRVRIVPNPVDLPRIAAAAAEAMDDADRDAWVRPAIVAAGRLAEAKNIPLLVDAVALLPPDLDAHLFVLGEGDHAASIHAAIARHGLGDRVRLCGFRRNPWRYFANADLFALTSRYEGFGNVLVEAMACGVPVVATGSPGTRDIVQDGANGLLVEAHTPAAVAAALERVLRDADLRSRLADGARRSAERYALPAIVGQYEALFEELTAA